MKLKLSFQDIMRLLSLNIIRIISKTLKSFINIPIPSYFLMTWLFLLILVKFNFWAVDKFSDSLTLLNIIIAIIFDLFVTFLLFLELCYRISPDHDYDLGLERDRKILELLQNNSSSGFSTLAEVKKLKHIYKHKMKISRRQFDDSLKKLISLGLSRLLVLIKKSSESLKDK